MADENMGVILEELEHMQLIIQTYEEVAAIRMQRIRANVITKRPFVDELEHVYGIVRDMYGDEIAALLKKKNRDSSQMLQRRNGKTLAVYLSANSGLYGDIVKRTFLYFMEDVKKHPEYSIAIVGKVGKELAAAYNMEENIQYFSLPDEAISKEQLIDLLTVLLTYENVVLYHGMFKNMLEQDPQSSRFYTPKPNVPKGKIRQPKWIIDPSLEDILTFFETELFSSFLIQIIDEGQLAKYASRIATLEEATSRIDEEVKKTTERAQSLMHLLQNKKQNDMLSGIQLIDLQ